MGSSGLPAWYHYTSTYTVIMHCCKDVAVSVWVCLLLFVQWFCLYPAYRSQYHQIQILIDQQLPPAALRQVMVLAILDKCSEYSDHSHTKQFEKFYCIWYHLFYYPTQYLLASV